MHHILGWNRLIKETKRGGTIVALVNTCNEGSGKATANRRTVPAPLHETRWLSHVSNILKAIGKWLINVNDILHFGGETFGESGYRRAWNKNRNGGKSKGVLVPCVCDPIH